MCLPARDEAATIGAIVAEAVRLEIVSEVVVLDDGSTDATAAVASGPGHARRRRGRLLPETGPGSGKGNAMWKSLYACAGDVICWVDADLRNFRGEYVERLCAPLLAQPDTMFVKAYYNRSFEGAPTGGGRVTELVARPAALAAVPQARRRRATARRRIRGAAQRARGASVRRRLGRRARRSSSTSSSVSAATRSRRSISTCASTATVRSSTSGLRRSPCSPPRCAAAVCSPTRWRPSSSCSAPRPTVRSPREPVEVRERPPIITVPAYRARFAPPR